MMRKSSLALTALVFLACLTPTRAAETGCVPEQLTCYPECCRPNGIDWLSEHAEMCWHSCRSGWHACSCSCQRTGGRLVDWLGHRSGRCRPCQRCLVCTPYCSPPVYAYFLTPCCYAKEPGCGDCGGAPVVVPGPMRANP
jgi:hypothetical protein